MAQKPAGGKHSSAKSRLTFNHSAALRRIAYIRDKNDMNIPNADFYVSSVSKRTDNLTGNKVWMFRLNNPRRPIIPKETLQFDWQRGQVTFSSQDEYELCIAAIKAGRNIAIRFHALSDAIWFLKILEPSEIQDQDTSGEGVAA